MEVCWKVELTDGAGRCSCSERVRMRSRVETEKMSALLPEDRDETGRGPDVWKAKDRPSFDLMFDRNLNVSFDQLIIFFFFMSLRGSDRK